MSAHGPMRREYSKAEVAAARRLRLAHTDTEGWPQPVKVLGGPLVWATGPYWPEKARQNANDWTLVADAMEREWTKEIPGDHA